MDRQLLTRRVQGWNTRAPWLSTVALATIGTALTWLRVPPAARDTFYAEDGTHFVADWLADDSIRTLFKPYAGYQHFVPRSLARVAMLTPPEWWARVTTIAACLGVGVVSALVYFSSRSLLPSSRLRLGLAAIPVLIPLAAVEAIGNLANLHWYFLFLFPWLLLLRPRTAGQVVALGLLTTVVTLTEPQCLIFAPLVAWLAWKQPRTRAVALGWAVGIGVQALTFVIAGSARPRPPGMPPVLSFAKGYLVNVPMALGNAHGKVLGWALGHGGWIVGVAVLALFLGIAGWAFVAGNVRERVATCALVCASVVAWTVSYGGNNIPDLYYLSLPGPPSYVVPVVRWGMAAGMFLAACIPVAGAVWMRVRPALSWLAIALVGALLVVMVASFRIENVSRQNDPWTERLEHARVTCSAPGMDVDIPTSPPGYSMKVPCAAIR